MSTMKVLLSAPGARLCGRGIQFRELNADEVQECADEGARTVGAGDSREILVKGMQEGWKVGAMRMLVAVTKRAGLTEEEFLRLGPDDWESLNLVKLQGDGPFSYAKLFGRAQDCEEMVALYREWHVVSPKTHEIVAGKAIPVSTED